MRSNASWSLLTLTLLFRLVMCNVAIAAVDASTFASRLPHWIWTSDRVGTLGEIDSDGEDLRIGHAAHVGISFTKEIEISKPVRTASIRLAADFCEATVFINQVRVLSVEPYCQTVDVDITQSLSLGKNLVRIQVKKVPGPSAIAATVSLGIAEEGQLVELSTDASWGCSAVQSDVTNVVGEMMAVSLGQVTPELWGTGRRSAKVDASENYEQWQQATQGTLTSENKFWAAPGFEISLVRSATPEEGSWVSMAFDPEGRLTVAREDKGLLQLTLDDSHRQVSRIQTINADLLECRGLLYAHGALYANANNSKGLYRLRDDGKGGGDGLLKDVQLLREFPGGVGHGRNDLALGPDCWVYSIHGDSVELPTTNILDRTSPFRDSIAGATAGQGYLMKTDPNGKQWEVVCSGLRNPFGLAVNPNGDWFTYDADAEFDMGAPWYRPTRVLHLVSGADFGWRAVTGKWPPFFPDQPDNAMPTLDIGKGSPTAVMFGTNANFPQEYRRSLFVLDWTYGRVLAIHLTPRGAGYRANAETFLQGRPLNVTDLAIGPDGALFIITGGRKTQSALYRIAFVGDKQQASPVSLHESQCIDHAGRVVAIRKELESYHASSTAENLDLVWRQLDSPDPTIRHTARVALEHQPLAKWRDQALSETRVTAAIEASLALIRSGEKSLVTPVLDRLVLLDATKLNMSQTWGLLRCYSLLSDSAMLELQEKRSAVIKQFDFIFPRPRADCVAISECGTSSQLQGAMAILLASLDSESVVESVSQTLLLSESQEDRLCGLLAIRNAKSGWTIDSRKRFFGVLNTGATFLRGEGMESFLLQLRSDAIANLTESERKELTALIAPAPEFMEDLVAPAPRAIVKQWSVSELVPLLADDDYEPDSSRGEAVFRDALCSQCHRSGARGPAVGPDLTHVSSRFSRQDILAAIVEPSQVVAETYRKVQVTTTDGRAVVGRVLVEGDYRSQTLRISTDPLRPSVIQEIKKSEIDTIVDSPVSPMPTGLLDSFSASDILDLLQYLSVAPSP